MRFGIASFVLSSSSPSSPPFFFFFLIGMCSTYPRLISSCSSCSEMYALSRHRCCLSLLLVPSLDLCYGSSRCRRRLITELSTTSITSLISWVLAGDITTDSGISSLSVKMCRFVPSLLLLVGLFPIIAPIKVTLSIGCQQGIAIRSNRYLFCHHIIPTA